MGNIPNEYADIQTLWKINFSSNALSGSVPEFIGDLPSIRLLDFSRNGFTGEIPSALFKYCYKTKFVSLSHNILLGSIPESLANCLNLEGLDYFSLRSNALSGNVVEQLSTGKIPEIATCSEEMEYFDAS
ncbi:unnamed protein product [Prunus armeniaca]|uniref:Leucine-rich repeat-containing N-terminal plant-type domain-containing protein n=1 Tax=Prunus armeniaca TaxID=36596 RepID=A0A6J5YEC2_PRUAR|nr:unnamed protein product [Prunus armeniaca]